jgi:hypothetical protein
VARGYTKAIRQTRRLIYLEDQYLWSPEVAATLAVALQRNPRLHLVAVLPLFPDQDGRISMPPNLVARDRVIATLRAVAPGRVASTLTERGRWTICTTQHTCSPLSPTVPPSYKAGMTVAAREPDHQVGCDQSRTLLPRH